MQFVARKLLYWLKADLVIIPDAITYLSIVTSVGTTALAAHHLAVTAESLSYLPTYGLGVAATTLVAQSLGAGEKQMVYQYGRLCTLFGIILMAIGRIILFLFSNPPIQLFTKDQAVIEQGGGIITDCFCY